MKTFRKRAFYLLGAGLMAYSYFIMTDWLFREVAEGDMLVMLIWNLVLILSMLIIERMEKYIYRRIKARDKKNGATWWSKTLAFTFYNVSLKSTLYLFYIGVLICYALLAADPDFPHISHMSDYLQSVYYGALILFASDKLLEQVFKDVDSNDADAS
ncbi:MAG: hypothetical protein FWC99_04310 [Coriobacteriia bacterium]|nr:hypothetical protein [Coriobacteriia bacterium]